MLPTATHKDNVYFYFKLWFTVLFSESYRHVATGILNMLGSKANPKILVQTSYFITNLKRATTDNK